LSGLRIIINKIQAAPVTQRKYVSIHSTPTILDLTCFSSGCRTDFLNE
jgi:hypothetical protein